MMKALAILLIIASCTYSQVVTQNWAGHWNIVGNNAASKAFSNVVVSGNGSSLDQIYGRARFGCCEAPYIYFWSSEAARDAGDTAAGTVVASIRAFSEAAGARTLTLIERNGSGYNISMQFKGATLALEPLNFDIGLMNVTVPMIQKASGGSISDSITAFGRSGTQAANFKNVTVADTLGTKCVSLSSGAPGGLFCAPGGSGFIRIDATTLNMNTAVQFLNAVGFYGGEAAAQCTLTAAVPPNPITQALARKLYDQALQDCLDQSTLNLVHSP